MGQTNNLRVRMAMFRHKIPQWKLGKLLGVSENTIWRMLREEMSEEDQDKLVAIIEEMGVN